MTARGGGAGSVRFQGTKKRPAEGEYLNTLVTNAVKGNLKYNIYIKYKAEHGSSSEEYQENFNFEDLNIGEEWYNAHRNQENEAEVPGKTTDAEQQLRKISHIVNPIKKKKIVTTHLYY